MTAALPCLGYARHGLALSVADQVAAIEAWATLQGATLDQVLIDEPVTLPEQEGRRAQEVLERGGASALLDLEGDEAVVIVADLAALERPDLPELAHLRATVLVAGEDELPRPSRTAQPEVPAQSVVARLAHGRLGAAARGLHPSGPAPYGYRRHPLRGGVLEPQPEEAEIVRTIFAEYLRLKSLRRVIELLDARGLSTRGGKAWSRAGLAWILRNETYVGRIVYGGVRARGRHPALVSPILFNRAGVWLRRNDKRARGAA